MQDDARQVEHRHQGRCGPGGQLCRYRLPNVSYVDTGIAALQNVISKLRQVLPQTLGHLAVPPAGDLLAHLIKQGTDGWQLA